MIALAMLLAAAPAGEGGSLIIGPGNLSCATVMKPEYDGGRASWIGGFWSAVNLTTPNGQVGHTIDPEAIIGDVAQYCRRHPTETLLSATAAIYGRYKREGG